MNDFTGYGKPMHVNTCNCDECLGDRVRAQMRAATCKCGHVGAECFNDSYCAPVEAKLDHSCTLMDCSSVHRTELNEANKYARNLEDRCTDLDSKLQNANAEIESMQKALEDALYWRSLYEQAIESIKDRNEALNDLQADYARDMSNEREVYKYMAEYIDNLETTVHVLVKQIR